MKYQSKVILIILFLFLILLFVPYGYHIDLGPGPDALQAVLWEIYGINEEAFFRVTPVSRIYLEFNIYRYFAFVGLIFYYIFNIRRLYIISLGVISELIPFILSIRGFLILNEQGDNLFPIIIPIPILTLVILVLLYFVPKKSLKKDIED
jgi:hypothetical protein